jgi:hypothetical protein
MKNPVTRLFLALLLAVLPVALCQAATGSEDGKLRCALTKVVECNVSGECLDLAAEDVGLPNPLIIDLEEKKLLEATSVSLRETSFNVHSKAAGMIVLSGTNGLRGWSAVLTDNHARLSLSVSDEISGFIVFGACRAE